MVDSISNKITLLIKENVSDISEEKAEIINYGLSLIIYEIFLTATTFVLAAVFGILREILISFAVFGTLRICTGGAHGRTRAQCFVVHNLTLFGAVFLARHLWSGSIYPGILLMLASLAAAYAYAPGDTEEKPIKSRKMILRQKILSILFISVSYILAFILWPFYSVGYNIIILTAVSVIFWLTPAGYFIARCRHSGFSAKADSF